MKRRETNPASNQFLRCSPPSGTHRDSQSWIEKRWGRKETEKTKKENEKSLFFLIVIVGYRNKN